MINGISFSTEYVKLETLQATPLSFPMNDNDLKFISLLYGNFL